MPDPQQFPDAPDTRDARAEAADAQGAATSTGLARTAQILAFLRRPPTFE